MCNRSSKKYSAKYICVCYPKRAQTSPGTGNLETLYVSSEEVPEVLLDASKDGQPG